ncbi:MAG: FAD-dependent oxidoreductase [Elusimicrobia bacterium]|nr:FAD-dependent oxidoreductase [Elusimicrobiota bacterium]
MSEPMEKYDVVIVGGGVTGAGTARDCAMRGFKTLLVERGRPGGATTAASTHLIHGGLRYLLYDRLTTHMTCWDSGHIVRIAGDLLTRLPILWPVYDWHSHGLETVETLLESYDYFQRMKSGKAHLRVSARAALDLVPGLKPEGLVGGVLFDEWWVDPLKLVDKNLDSARRHGARVETGAAVERLVLEGGAVRGILTRGGEIKADLVINAAGPWVGRVAAMAGAEIPLRLRKGTHLVYNRRVVPVGLLLEAVEKGRYIFAVPFDDGTLVGPTDVDAGDDPSKIETSSDEVESLSKTARFYLSGLPERHDSTIVGARPILGRGKDERLLSRQYEVFDHESRDGVSGFLTIGGGKMSDFRAMAEAVTDAAGVKLGRTASCRASAETLDGRPVGNIPEFPKPVAVLKRIFRTRPRLRQMHALAYLAAGYLRHWRIKKHREVMDSASNILSYYRD